MAEQQPLFGSDGYRGLVDETGQPGRINEATFAGLAFIYADLIAEQTGEPPVIVVGGDTRASSSALAAATMRGAAAAGAEVWDMGSGPTPTPTPTIGWAAQKNEAYGFAITASHNTAEYNGIKPLAKGGVKLDSATNDEIEHRYWAWQKAGGQLPEHAESRIRRRDDLTEDYLDHLVAKLGGDGVLANKLIVVDGANGAASELSPRLYQRLGAMVVTFACDTGGIINHNSGAAHLGGLRQFLSGRPGLTSQENFVGAFSNDGDADRVMGLTGQYRGERHPLNDDIADDVVNGNHWLNILADADQKGIVGTLYTNSALRRAVQARNVDFHVCGNGDAQVTAMLHELTAAHGPGYTRGGEFTGHDIDTEHLPSGDGIYMGGMMAVHLARQKATLADVYNALPLWPETMIPVAAQELSVKQVKAILDGHEVATAKQSVAEMFGTDVNTIVRASGTEPLARVWAEGLRAEDAKAAAQLIANAVRSRMPGYSSTE